MRSHPTDVERRFGWRLRDRNLGLRLPGGQADFVELDGAQHQGSNADRVRSQHLSRIGFDVVRF
jgi:hypothetical protein